MDIQDLGRCASVSRSWKLIIQSSLLWSKMDFTKMKYKYVAVSDSNALSANTCMFMYYLKHA